MSSQGIYTRHHTESTIHTQLIAVFITAFKVSQKCLCEEILQHRQEIHLHVCLLLANCAVGHIFFSLTSDVD